MEQYGAECIAFVLSNTLQQNEQDGRFSKDNKIWAAEMVIAEEFRGLVVSSHPVVLNGFVDLFRQEVKELKVEHNIQKQEDRTEKKAATKVNICVDENDILAMAEKIKQNKVNDNRYKHQVDLFMQSKMKMHDVFVVAKTPNVLKLLGAKAETVVINQSDFRNAINAKDIVRRGHTSGHGISVSNMKKLSEQIRNPVLVCEGSLANSVVLVTELLDKDGKNIITPVYLDVRGRNCTVNRISTVYGKDNIISFLQSREIIAYNKEKTDRLFTVISANSLISTSAICFDNSIAYTTANVKTLGQKNVFESSPVEDGVNAQYENDEYENTKSR